MTSANYTGFRAKHITSCKFGSVAWTSANFTSTTSALDTTFALNNPTPLADFIGVRNANNPVTSDAFAKEIKVSGGDRSAETEDLLGATSGTQNQEISTGPHSLLNVEMTLVYRNNVTYGIFNDTTKCCIVTMDNSESIGTGKVNFAFNNIFMTKVGDLSRDSGTGLMTQMVTFSCKGGTSTSVAVTEGAETYSKEYGGDYSEEVRTA